MDISNLLPSLPEWLAIPLILIAVFVWLWPKMAGVIRDFRTSSRVHVLEKQRLELLKLRYEIEAIKKENGLFELQEDSIIPEIEVSPSENLPKAEDKPAQVLGFWTRFGYGAGGSALPILVNLALFDWRLLFQELDMAVLLGYAIRLVVFAALAGVGSAFIARHPTTRPMCFLIGLSITLFLSLLLASARSPS